MFVTHLKVVVKTLRESRAELLHRRHTEDSQSVARIIISRMIGKHKYFPSVGSAIKRTLVIIEQQSRRHSYEDSSRNGVDVVPEVGENW